MKYTIVVQAIAEDGEAIFVGRTTVRAETEEQARSRAINRLWDDRLTSAGCRAVAAVIGCVP